ncbi:MAG TPA: ribosome small subunit-dependent GTPase A [Chthonomonadales bacterium]|nr:ribosome small subunit-dependent GTPase A [Chthonomonadales bacterium]
MSCELKEADARQPELREGLVLRAVNGLYLVQIDTEGPVVQLQCSLRGNLKKSFQYSTSASTPRRVTSTRRHFARDPVAIGDRVRVQALSTGSGVIEEILPRHSRFERAAFGGRAQTMVSNLDQLAIVFACAEPRPDLYRLDRWLVTAECHGLSPLIVANKRDLVEEQEFQAAFCEYLELGYRVIESSAVDEVGLQEVREALRGRITAFTGPSGVGKSSLLNALQPGLGLITGELGQITFKGRHTTTTRELIPLSFGGWAADTPGLRQLEFLSLDEEDILNGFVECRSLPAPACRFPNCRHQTEPGCRILQAVQDEVMSARRYRSLIELMKSA